MIWFLRELNRTVESLDKPESTDYLLDGGDVRDREQMYVAPAIRSFSSSFL